MGVVQKAEKSLFKIHGDTAFESTSFEEVNDLKKVYVETILDKNGNSILKQSTNVKTVFIQINSNLLNN